MISLQGKRILVTGATSGIGFEAARAFLKAGARLVVSGSTQKTADAAAAKLDGDVLPVGADARDLDGQRALAALAADHFGRLDAAFLNAGVSNWRPFLAHDEASFDRLFDINVKSTFFLMQALVPVMASPSSVIITSSNSAHGGTANSNAYAASKAALSSLARSWNADLLREHGIRFNTVSPGSVDTPLYAKMGLDAEAQAAAMERIRGGIPAGRLGRASEIASLAIYLASDESEFAVGHDFVVDGGQSILY